MMLTWGAACSSQGLAVWRSSPPEQGGARIYISVPPHLTISPRLALPLLGLQWFSTGATNLQTGGCLAPYTALKRERLDPTEAHEKLVSKTRGPSFQEAEQAVMLRGSCLEKTWILQPPSLVPALGISPSGCSSLSLTVNQPRIQVHWVLGAVQANDQILGAGVGAFTYR